jgi:imidazolonepropionase-like amidohydrolase
VAHLVPVSGVCRGRSALVALRDGAPDVQAMALRLGHVLAFERDPGGGTRPPAYPNSTMGAMALLRQTLLDADWARRVEAAHAAGAPPIERPENNASLLALSGALPAYGGAPVWIETGDVLGLLRSAALAREFGLAAVLVGSGDEYRRLDSVRQAGYPVVLPLDYPDPPAFEDEADALNVELDELQHWDLAAGNAHQLHQAGLRFAFTAQGLKKRSTWRARVRQAIERGLPADAALAACTLEPARLLGQERRLGSIEPGKAAHLTVTDGELFDDGTAILEVWVDGDRYVVHDRKRDSLDRVRGDWTLAAGGAEAPAWDLHVEGSQWNLEAELRTGSETLRTRDVRWSQLELVASLRDGRESLRLKPAGRSLRGTWTRADGTRLAVEAKRAATADRPDAAAHGERAEAAASASPGAPWPPRPAPAPAAVLVRGATVWTCGPRGVLERADVLAQNGKITAVGPHLKAPAGAQVVEAEGLHVTPGLIDCHSHSNIVGGVNEATHICTAEVRIADVLNSESIAIYRELAGGLTTSNQLHGSANSIGGQNAVMKLRWGAPPQDLLFEGAPPGIKFALGENPKQSNWDDRNDRYPQTRMGVEQSIRERFMAARDYMRAWDEYGRRKDRRQTVPPRRDLQLEAVAEILRGERLVHCHSYRGDEILMMTRLAEEFGFRVATFQHVLEGYKVADELAAHGAGASSFSDWWGYKFEVYDAIPHSGSLMHERGVTVSFNSDSAELARRLNLEATKAVKYGGTPDPEALLFVTLNPAKQLGIDARVGSLEPGKDADFAIWSGPPLDSASRCEQTWVDGRRYFDRATDLAARDAMEVERLALLERARAARDKLKKDDGDEPGGAWRPSFLEDDHDATCHDEDLEVRP